ncbi:MAG: ThiF family adenylyltransferase [Gammaproteobacteria bacterium]|nr:ThiF family adenylyltransferase [Gammaproteobacteria bacterium]
MNFEVAFSESLAESAKDHLLSSLRKGQEQEDLCFALWRPSVGNDRTTALITDLVLPVEDDRLLHGNVSFEADYLARAARFACESNAGLAFMHSHPSNGWQGMSETDIIAERDRIAPPARATGYPLVGLTVGMDGVWSARFWRWNGNKYVREDCRKVRTVGQSIDVHFNPSHRRLSAPAARLRRTIDTWGVERQSLLSNLKFGVIGLGSVGTAIAEILARVGVSNLLLIDADSIEEHNLDRMLYATAKDIGRYKVDVVASHLKQTATATSFQVHPMRAWLQESDAYSASLDCDVLFAAVDRPLPKDLLNNIAYVHYIPVVFGGIRVATKPSGKLADATWSVVNVAPGSRCLRCDGQYTTSDVTLERDGSLDDPSYIVGGTAQSGNENVFPFSLNLGSLMVLEMLRGILREDWWPNPSSKIHYSFLASRFTTEKSECRNGCSVWERTGSGDRWIYPFLDDPIDRSTEHWDSVTSKSWLERWWRDVREFFGGRS